MNSKIHVLLIMLYVARLINIETCVGVDSVYENHMNLGEEMEPFSLWLRQRCLDIPPDAGRDMESLRSLSKCPSRRVCSFKSMTTYGSHYRVEGEGAGDQHVTFDSGVAELQAHGEFAQCSEQGGIVHMKRVGILKDILVFDYGTTNIVLMEVSWVAADTDMEPRMRRDCHGFWLANLEARPRCCSDPYILPSLASQVPPALEHDILQLSFRRSGGSKACRHIYS